jgi:hypothetical protein
VSSLLWVTGRQRHQQYCKTATDFENWEQFRKDHPKQKKLLLDGQPKAIFGLFMEGFLAQLDGSVVSSSAGQRVPGWEGHHQPQHGC